MLTVDEVCELIRKKLGGKAGAGAELGGHSTFDEIGLSSLEVADIVYGIEDRLGIEFDPAEAAKVKTIKDLVALANATVAA